MTIDELMRSLVTVSRQTPTCPNCGKRWWQRAYGLARDVCERVAADVRVSMAET